MKKNIPPPPRPPPNRLIKESEDLDDIKKDKCLGLFGKIFGHKFRARYSESESEGKYPGDIVGDKLYLLTGVFADDTAKILDSSKSHERVYIRDICDRCGKVINQQK